MKRFSRLLIIALATTSIALNGCKKNNIDTDADLTTDEVSVQADDQSMFSAEEDAISNEVNLSIEADPTLAGRETGNLICDASIRIDTTATTKGVIITYNDTANCSQYRKRTGVIKISMPRTAKWKDAGTTVTVEFMNFKVTRLPQNKSVTFNGTKTITNVSGGLLAHLALNGPIVHTINSSGITATFDNGTSRQWMIAKKRVFTYNNGVVITTTGTYNDGTNSDVAVWGTNRLGQTFSTRIVAPTVIRQDCNFRLVSGKIQHTRLARPIDVTFGLDASGNAVTCPAGNFYFKAEWTSAAGVTHSIIHPY